MAIMARGFHPKLALVLVGSLKSLPTKFSHGQKASHEHGCMINQKMSIIANSKAAPK